MPFKQYVIMVYSSSSSTTIGCEKTGTARTYKTETEYHRVHSVVLIICRLVGI